jgi:hypothetical protein
MSLVFAGPETQGFFQRRCTRWLAVAIVVTGLCISGQDPSLADVKDLENVTVRGVYDPNALRLHLVQMEGAYGLMEKLNPTQGLQAPAEPDTNDRAVNERDCEETENPVVLASGNKVLDQADFSTAPGDFVVSRTYSRAGGFFNGFGSHWTWSFNYFLMLEPNPGWSPICQPGTFEPGVPCPLCAGQVHDHHRGPAGRPPLCVHVERGDAALRGLAAGLHELDHRGALERSGHERRPAEPRGRRS